MVGCWKVPGILRWTRLPVTRSNTKNTSFGLGVLWCFHVPLSEYQEQKNISYYCLLIATSALDDRKSLTGSKVLYSIVKAKASVANTPELHSDIFISQCK
jgi:hypothetical protein